MAVKFWKASGTRYLKELADNCGAICYATTLDFFLSWDQVTSYLTEQGSVSLLILAVIQDQLCNSLSDINQEDVKDIFYQRHMASLSKAVSLHREKNQML